jgi:hypothetical protein
LSLNLSAWLPWQFFLFPDFLEIQGQFFPSYNAAYASSRSGNILVSFATQAPRNRLYFFLLQFDCCRKGPLIIIRLGRPGWGRWARQCHADSAWPGPLTAAASAPSHGLTVGLGRCKSQHGHGHAGTPGPVPARAADSQRGGPRGTRKPGRLPGKFTGSQVQFGLTAD